MTLREDTASDQWTELERLAKAATPGPWNDSGGSVDDFDADCAMRMEWMPNGRPDDGDEDDVNANWKADTAFIAAANPAAILELITAARASSVGTNGEAGSEQKPDRELVEALRPFAIWAEAFEGDACEYPAPDSAQLRLESARHPHPDNITVADLRKARSALSRHSQTGNGEGV